MRKVKVFRPSAQRIASLPLPGMHATFLKQMAHRDGDRMPFEERLAMPIDREIAARRSRALQQRLKKARLRHSNACFEGHQPRPSPRARPQCRPRLRRLRLGPQRRRCPHHRPVRHGQGLDLLRSRPQGLSRRPPGPVQRAPRLLTASCGSPHGKGTILKLCRDFARIEGLILDGRGLAPIDAARGRDLLEVLDHRSAPGRLCKTGGRATAWCAHHAKANSL